MKFARPACLFAWCCLIACTGWSQRQEDSPTIVRFTSSYTAFPDTGRAMGHSYSGVLYTSREHYSDSSVMVIVPAHFRPAEKIDMIFWFHGWNNNIDTALDFYELKKQFLASKRNAVLVLAETAKNAPDSYGGKLEHPGYFKHLVGDVIHHLNAQHIIPKKTTEGHVVLAGHSGAYRVIAYILAYGGAPVDEVYLFDALYGETDKFLSWLGNGRSHHFVNVFTDHGGGTNEVSFEMMRLLDSSKIAYRFVEEQALRPADLTQNKILFVHSNREHNVIINRPDNFLLMLDNSQALRPKAKL